MSEKMEKCAYVRPAIKARCEEEAREGSDFCSAYCELETMHEEICFQHWMQKLITHLESEHGLHPDDLPDVAYRDWYDLELSPEGAGRRALAEAVNDT